MLCKRNCIFSQKTFFWFMYFGTYSVSLLCVSIAVAVLRQTTKKSSKTPAVGMFKNVLSYRSTICLSLINLIL